MAGLRKGPGSGRSRRGASRKRPRKIGEGFSYRGNRLAQLRAFIAIAKLGSLSRAAESLSLSQPSVSLQLAALERELGSTLVTRGRRRRVELTPSGRSLYDMARPLVDGMDGIDAQFRTRAPEGDAAGELRIAAGAAAIRHLLPPLVGAYRRAHPGVRLHLQQAGGEDALELLRAGGVELVIGSPTELPADLTCVPLCESDPVLIAPPGHPLAATQELRPQDIAAHGLILPAQRRSTWRLVDLVFRRHGIACNVAMEGGDWDTIKSCVAMGFGISIVSELCLTPADREHLAVRNLRAHFPPRRYGILARRQATLSAQARALIDIAGTR